MTEVSRIVRERLNQPAGEHPDANLLSAFAERSLTDAERAQVLDHLSRCAECREVAALALPAVEEEQLAAAVREPTGASRSWWRSPVVHWTALTAAALVVLIAVGERMKLHEGHSASAPAIATSSSNEAAQKPVGETSQVPAFSGEPKKQSLPMAEIPTTPPPAEKRSPAGVAGTAGSGKAAGLNKALGPAAKKVAPAAPPAVLMKPSESITSKGRTVTLQKDGQFDQVQAQAAAPPPSVGTRDRLASGNAAAGKFQTAPATENRVVIAGQPHPPLNFVRPALPSPRWSVSDSGVVQRSLDGGRTWKEVAVADGIVFRAVAVLVNDIWAGGSGGALFHSADGGQHWLPVPVQFNGRSISGDIVRLDFAGASNVVVTSSTGEVWTTSDGGAHWRVQ